MPLHLELSLLKDVQTVLKWVLIPTQLTLLTFLLISLRARYLPLFTIYLTIASITGIFVDPGSQSWWHEVFRTIDPALTLLRLLVTVEALSKLYRGWEKSFARHIMYGLIGIGVGFGLAVWRLTDLGVSFDSAFEIVRANRAATIAGCALACLLLLLFLWLKPKRTSRFYLLHACLWTLQMTSQGTLGVTGKMGVWRRLGDVWWWLVDDFDWAIGVFIYVVWFWSVWSLCGAANRIVRREWAHRWYREPLSVQRHERPASL